MSSLKNMDTQRIMEELKLKPIGYVSSPVTEKMDENWGLVTSRILLNPDYAGALSGFEDFSHAIIITYLHQSSL
jgi:tRNA (Thr-GGU) A37 N-methylase